MIKKIKWNNGNGELLGFSASLILWFMIIVSMMSFSYYTIRREQLTTATYAVGRAAVVSDSFSQAQDRAYAVLKTIYGTDHCGTTSGTSKGYVWYEIKKMTDDSKTIAYTDSDSSDPWEIGTMAKITLHQVMPGVFPFNAGTIESSVVMMVETTMFNGV